MIVKKGTSVKKDVSFFERRISICITIFFEKVIFAFILGYVCKIENAVFSPPTAVFRGKKFCQTTV